jgi:hypothetical protein
VRFRAADGSQNRAAGDAEALQDLALTHALGKETLDFLRHRFGGSWPAKGSASFFGRGYPSLVILW